MTQKWYTILLRQAEQKRQKTERKSGSTSCKVSNRMYWIQTTWNNKTSGLKTKQLKNIGSISENMKITNCQWYGQKVS